MIQTIDFAPLDGITKIVFRQVWSQFFGGVDRYFIPFFSPTPHHLMTPRDLREVDYIHNANLPSVPQVMTKNANDFLWTCDVLKVNLPSFFSTVTPGQLPTNWLEPVKALNNVVFPQFGLPASAIFTAITFLLLFLVCCNLLLFATACFRLL